VLEGISVLDMTQVMAGPYCAMLLCDMGADVIKIEPPDGDWTRNLAGAVGVESPAFNAVNRGKRGIVLDLKQRAAQEVFRRLAAAADVIVENYRPGVMTRLGLDYASLAPSNPRLIYASISGYGQTGPDGPKGGFDLVAQGVSGLMSITGEPGGPPVKVGVPVTDLGAGLFALAGILAALHARGRTGRGQYVDTSLVEAGIALSVWEATEYFSTGSIPQPTGSAHRLSAPYQALRCADGYITIGAANDRTFAKLCDLLGRPEWVNDPRPERVDARSAVHEQRPPRRAPHRPRVDYRRGDDPEAARALAAAIRRRRHPVRADQHLRRRVPRSAGPRARDARRGRSSGARPDARARHADQDVRDTAQPAPAGAAARGAYGGSATRDWIW